MITSRQYTTKHLSCFQRCLNFLKLDIGQLSLNQMRQLPKWLKADVLHDCIILSGTPKHTDLSKIVIQIYNADILLKEFLLEILEKCDYQYTIADGPSELDMIGDILAYNQKKFEEQRDNQTLRRQKR